MRLKELLGLPVIDPTAARKIGTVADYQVDPAAGCLAALDVTPLDGGDGQRVLAQRIRRVGGSAVMLTERGGSMPSSASELNERWLDGSTLVGLEVMGDDGTRVGHLVDATFDQDSLAIGAYMLQGSSLLDSFSGKRNRIEPNSVQSCSRELMLIANGHSAAEAVAPSETPARADGQATTPTQETAPLETSVPLKEVDKLKSADKPKAPDKPRAADKLKEADKLASPSYDTVPDGHPVSTSSN
ncbi:MAG TPA: PRC-barrel domain-containing protein [Chloroflexota bacterium]|jgi:sporulation protein YlmC with PRC-barrel domain